MRLQLRGDDIVANGVHRSSPKRYGRFIGYTGGDREGQAVRRA
jgi:hypothetical protein